MKIKTIFFPIVLIWRLIYSTYLDIKFLVDVMQGKKKFVSDEIKEEWNRSDKRDIFKNVFKTYWWVYTLLFAAFLCGIFISSQYYQGKCNEFILENYVEDNDFWGNKTPLLPFVNITAKIEQVKEDPKEVGIER